MKQFMQPQPHAAKSALRQSATHRRRHTALAQPWG
ncbi:hypothetical protein BN439_2661 [Erwinia amylovora Ea644]|nr:hypothetical protein BN439_2661 [Erwinia amylovora Ea644]